MPRPRSEGRTNSELMKRLSGSRPLYFTRRKAMTPSSSKATTATSVGGQVDRSVSCERVCAKVRPEVSFHSSQIHRAAVSRCCSQSAIGRICIVLDITLKRTPFKSSERGVWPTYQAWRRSVTLSGQFATRIEQVSQTVPTRPVSARAALQIGQDVSGTKSSAPVS
jgi:hypothetical protein